MSLYRGRGRDHVVAAGQRWKSVHTQGAGLRSFAVLGQGVNPTSPLLTSSRLGSVPGFWPPAIEVGLASLRLDGGRFPDFSARPLNHLYWRKSAVYCQVVVEVPSDTAEWSGNPLTPLEWRFLSDSTTPGGVGAPGDSLARVETNAPHPASAGGAEATVFLWRLAGVSRNCVKAVCLAGLLLSWPFG